MSNEDLSDTNTDEGTEGTEGTNAAEAGGAPNILDALDAAEAVLEGAAVAAEVPPVDGLQKSLDDFAASLNRFSDTVGRATNVIIDVAAKLVAQTAAPAKRRGRPPGKKTTKRKGKRR